MMVVAIGAVHMAVVEFFLRGSANIFNRHSKIQHFAGEWMVAIDRDAVAVDGSNRHTANFTARALRLKLHANFEFGASAKRSARYILD